MDDKRAMAMEAEFRAEDDLRTLTRAEEVHGDRSRLSQVKKLITKRQQMLRRAISGRRRR